MPPVLRTTADAGTTDHQSDSLVGPVIDRDSSEVDAQHPDRTVEVVLVTSPGCHYCDDAKGLLADLAVVHSFSVREVELSSLEGVDIATRFRVPFPPVLIVGGEYLGHGRISRRKLTKALEEAARHGAIR